MMSCNGCRVLRKGCSEDCVLRQCLRSTESSQSQGHATLFVAKFFGRAALLSLISAVPEPHRPALFQSLLFEAVGRTINPVGGVVGLLWTRNWQLCQAAVETVLRGGALHPFAEFYGSSLPSDADNCSESVVDDSQKMNVLKRGNFNDEQCDLDLSLMPVAEGKPKKRRPRTPASKGSKTTTFEGGSSSDSSSEGRERKLLRLFD